MTVSELSVSLRYTVAVSNISKVLRDLKPQLSSENLALAYTLGARLANVLGKETGSDNQILG